MFHIDTKKSEVKFKAPIKNTSLPLFSEEQKLEEFVLGKTSFRKSNKNSFKNLQRKPAWTDKDDESQPQINIHSKRYFGIVKPNEKEISALKYNERIKLRYQKNYQQPSWSDRKLKSKSATKTEFGNNVSNLIEKITWNVNEANNHLQFKWITDLRHLELQTNYDNLHLQDFSVEDMNMKKAKKKLYQINRITTLKFHPTYQVLLSTDSKGNFRLFEIQDLKSPKELQRIVLEGFDISSCHYLTSDSDQILFVASNATHLCNFDLISGKLTKIYLKSKYTSVNPKYAETSPDGRYVALYANKSGKITIISQKGKEIITSLHTTGAYVRSVRFTHDSNYLVAISDNGQIFVWDMSYNSSNSCISPSPNLVGQFADVSNFEALTLDITRNGRHLITGSQSGVVNLYDINGPNFDVAYVKSWKHLTLPCTTLISNPESQLLLFGSRYQKDCVKMVNLENYQLFTNFPGSQKRHIKKMLGQEPDENNPSDLTYMNGVTCADFSPNSAYLSLGSDKGNVNLYRLNSYTEY